MNPNIYNNFLQSYWSLDELSGTRNDCINTNHLVETSTITSTTGINKNCPIFSNSGYLQATHNNNMGNPADPQPFIISLWVNFNNVSNCSIIDKENCYGIYTQGVGNVGKLTSSISGNISTIIPVVIVNRWYHVLLGVVNNQSIFVIQSVAGQYYSVIDIPILSFDSTPLSIGKTMKGKIDEISLWYNTPLTSIDDILELEQSLYNNGTGTFYNCLQETWEIALSINNISSKFPLNSNPEYIRNTSLLNVKTYSYKPRKLENDASDSKSTIEKINSGSISFETISPGETSRTIIARLEVENSPSIKNIKIGLVDDGGITFTNTTFGITTSDYIDANIVPNTFFQGLSSSFDSIYNIAVENKTRTTSNYIYLNFKIDKGEWPENGVITYKWWFDYS